MRISEDKIEFFGNKDSLNYFIQMTDENDMEVMDGEIEAVRCLTGNDDWCVVTVKVDDWFQDLTPWEAPPVFGKTPFGSGASDTLKAITDELLPKLEKPGRRFYIAGYSLAGLFALWSMYESDAFCGAAAASPSVWYPGWIEYSEKREAELPGDRKVPVYLSLGDREEKTKNQVMAKVGNCIKRQAEIFEESGRAHTLEWNKGNHFVDSDKRTAKGIAWTLESTKQ